MFTHNFVTHIGCWFTSLLAAYGLLIQDVFLIVGSVIGGVCSIAVFIVGRIEAKRILREERRRTDMIEALILRIADSNSDTQKSALRRLIEATEKGGRK